MTMQFVYSKKAQKQFEKLDTITQKRIKNLTQELGVPRKPTKQGRSIGGQSRRTLAIPSGGLSHNLRDK